jgi:hypothetical protein
LINKTLGWKKVNEFFLKSLGQEWKNVVTNPSNMLTVENYFVYREFAGNGGLKDVITFYYKKNCVLTSLFWGAG